jgi:hypothetical protein
MLSVHFSIDGKLARTHALLAAATMGLYAKRAQAPIEFLKRLPQRKS